MLGVAMRVVHVVCSDGFGGVERYIANLALRLASRGVEVAVVGGAEASMRAALDDAGVEWLPGDDMAMALRSLRRLPTPDVVNTHMSEADAVGFAYRCVARGGRRVRHVSTRHFAGPRGSRAPARAALGLLARTIHRQLAISRFVADHIEGAADVVHSGVPVRKAPADRARTVLVAQRLEPEKDTETAVRAWALADAARLDGWRLVIAGDGSQRDRLEHLAGELGIRDSVDFLGFRSDVDALLQRAGLAITPTPREGLGIFVLEAMSVATPVVAAAGGGHLETVGAIRPDLLFPPGDAAAAARLIDELAADPARRAEAGSALQELQRSDFTIDRQADATRALYERLLAR